MNPNITWEIIQANLDKPWDWCTLSANPNITWKIVRDNPDRNWCWHGLSNEGLSSNPNITWKIVRNNLKEINEWSWRNLSGNTFDRITAVVIIQRKFRELLTKRCQHLEELRLAGQKYYYSPGNGGYQETYNNFYMSVKYEN